MEFPKQASLVRSKSPSFQYPTSHNQTRGEQILLSCHPQHPLALLTSPDPFTCMGCKEYGAGTRFTCQQCNHQLHEFCALAPTTLKSHPLHCQHPLGFCSKPGELKYMFSLIITLCMQFPDAPLLCNAFYGNDLSAGSSHPLTLMPAMTLSSGEPGFSCGECKRKRPGRVYRCTATACDYHLHAVCAKNMVNGLRANGVTCLEKPSMRGTFIKIASVVVMEFIGGLIGGLGQGVGDVLGQTMAAGKSASARRLE
ncbi:hypothetical protein CK203_005792 [Vitis vinifera]|uniref:DC1 domain-containing protein n=1 Tax=Vitis vinifera TaxID=29760 RepID=A0A438K3N2_VITVI|nr:hypothetical protein CK203_005792 [Vitis vinifera]